MKKIMLALLLMGSFVTGQGQVKDSTAEDNVLDEVEVEAEFPGGIPAWSAYLRKNLNGNVPLDNDAPIGKYTVIVRFIVSKTGTISDIQADTKHGYGLEKEVMRIIQKSPNWKPAIQNVRPVNAYRRQPVSFVVDDP